MRWTCWRAASTTPSTTSISALTVVSPQDFGESARLAIDVSYRSAPTGPPHRDLHHDLAVVGDQLGRSGEEAARVVDVRQPLWPPLPARSHMRWRAPTHLVIEEPAHRCRCRAPGHRGDVASARREGPDAHSASTRAGSHRARNLDHQIGGTQRELSVTTTRSREVRGHRLGNAADVEVVTKQRLGIDHVEELDSAHSVTAYTSSGRSARRRTRLAERNAFARGCDQGEKSAQRGPVAGATPGPEPVHHCD